MYTITFHAANLKKSSTFTPRIKKIYFFGCMRTTLILLFFIVVSCNNTNNNTPDAHNYVEPTLVASDPVLELLDPSSTGINFVNTIIETFEDNITTNINKYNGGGMAIGDINNDQLPDIFFINCSGKNALYLNKGGLKFEDITESALGKELPGFETSATMADVNADGWLDIYVCRASAIINDERRNQLFINNKDLTFTEQAKSVGLDDKSASTGANFFDADNDGDLDCYVLNFPTEGTYSSKVESYANPNSGKRVPALKPRKQYDTDRFYRNDNGKFVDISEKSGIWNLGYGLSVSVTDFNRDGFVDVYVGNDFIQPDNCYINNGNLTFTDRLETYFGHTSQHTMGTDITDYNNDGWVDLFALDMLGANNFRHKSFISTNSQSRYNTLKENGYSDGISRNVLQQNNQDGTFSEVGCLAGVHRTDWSWSGLFFDINNDGWRDLHITNGYRREVGSRDFIEFTGPELQKKLGGKRLQDHFRNFDEFLDLIPTYKPRNHCFVNQANGQFKDVSGEWITMSGTWSCGSAWADLDQDGDLDLVVSNVEEPAFVYKNLTADQKKGNYLQLKLNGSAANPFAVGASVLVKYNNGQIQYQELFPTRGIFSSVEYLMHFGLGTATTVDEITVRWPDGKTQTLSQIPANQRLKLDYTNASGYVKHLSPEPKSTYYLVNINDGDLFTHHENPFNDFDKWPLNPWKTTELGPVIVKGDVNGDGLEDMFIGNTFDKPSALLTQQPSGTLKATNQALWEADKLTEDHGGVFFDADGDGDQDLMVIGGGVEATDKIGWQLRLYINTDGKGKLEQRKGVFPTVSDGVGLRATSFDYDQDGDQDVFVGGRVRANYWPLAPKSYVLRNDKDKFTDVTATVAPEFERCGMVTDLQWVNINADPTPELVVCGEWMPITIFQLQNKTLKNITDACGLSNSNGIWWRLAAADLDGDGDQDLVSGNIGLNNRYRASEQEPFRCYASDIDKNTILDPILACYEAGKLYPTVQKDPMVKQLPMLKKKFLRSNAYGMAQVTDLFPNGELDKATQLHVKTLASCWWENQNGKFLRHDLPLAAQLSVNQGIVLNDLDKNGLPDIIIAGNKYGMDVETHRLDANTGVVLMNQGKGQFESVKSVTSGFRANKEARDLALLQNPSGKPLVVVANNNDRMQVYKIK
jgi:enediyne biosynthesis protein E4